MKLVFCIILFLCSTTNGESSADKDYYIGAVVDYASHVNITQGPEANTNRNLEEYLNYIQQAKEKDVDIIVFPECGLVGIGMMGVAGDLEQFTTVIPNPHERAIPCNNNKWSNILGQLSCAARNNKIYVAVNLPERTLVKTKENGEEIINYNTNIVFDRNGELISKYRKQNLYGEPGFNRSDTDDVTTFETDFGVTFGMFICFDILFAKPSVKTLRENENVTDIVYSTAWFSEMPFLTAVQTQSGWARAYGVNLLASGYNNPAHMSGGSGIFHANGIMSYTMPVSRQSTLIVNKIQKIKRRASPHTVDSNIAKVTIENNSSYSLKQMRTKIDPNITDYTSILINKTNVEKQQLCHGTFCCTFTIKFTPIENADYYYRLVAYDGLRSFTVENNDIQVCGLVACKTTSPETCGLRGDQSDNPHIFQEISISGPFRTDKDTVVIPTNTLYDLSVLKQSTFQYIVSDTKIEMRTTQEVKQLLTFGIYGVIKSSAISTAALVPLIVVSVVALLFNKN